MVTDGDSRLLTVLSHHLSKGDERRAGRDELGDDAAAGGAPPRDAPDEWRAIGGGVARAARDARASLLGQNAPALVNRLTHSLAARAGLSRPAAAGVPVVLAKRKTWNESSANGRAAAAAPP